MMNTFLYQLRDTRVEVLFFLEKFLDRMSPRVKGWEKTYAIDIRVSPSSCPHSLLFGFLLQLVSGIICFYKCSCAVDRLQTKV